jgi:hypothetical protein
VAPADTTAAALSAAARSRATGILEDCALVGVERLEEILALLEQSTGGLPGTAGGATGLPPGFRITGFNVFTGKITWALDLEPDGVDDVTGVFGFEDASGNPTFPFNPLDFLTGTPDLQSLLASLPDGTVVVTDFTVPPKLESDPLTTGHVEVTFDLGMPTQASGSVHTTSTDCEGSFSFDDVAADDVLAQYPTATVAASMGSSEGQLDGTIQADGTSQALVEMTLDQTDTFRWVLDLDTFQLTEAP